MIKNITREDTISLHRQMWEWIARKIEEEQEVQDIHNLKNLYMVRHGFNMRSNCFCCEYAKEKSVEEGIEKFFCKFCPVDWENPHMKFYPCEAYSSDYEPVFEEKDGIYGKCRKLFDNCELRDENCWEEQAEYAWQIANLKEKGEIS